jgi:DNA-binding transcriptional ArsR family regulator
VNRRVPRREILEVLFPKARAEILRLLFTNPKKERYVRELAHLSGLSLGTIQEELAILSAVGLLMSRSNGYHRFYRANREHEMFADILRIVHSSGRLAAVDVSLLRRVRRVGKRTKKLKPNRPVYPIRRMRPHGSNLFSQ